MTSAERSRPLSLYRAEDTVQLPTQLRRAGHTRDAIAAQIRARRWRRIGRAVVLHNGPMGRQERQRAVLLNCGPRAVLTAFTALEAAGLQRWQRDTVHVLVPGGARIHRVPTLSMRVHYAGDWPRVETTREGVHSRGARPYVAPAAEGGATSTPSGAAQTVCASSPRWTARCPSSPPSGTPSNSGRTR